MPCRIAIAAVLLTGCVGGQTGEITTLGACQEMIDEVALDQAHGAFETTAAEQLRQLGGPWSAQLQYESNAVTTTLDVDLQPLQSRAVKVIGGSGCEQPFYAVPSTLLLRSADGALNEHVEVTTEIVAGSASIRGEIAITSIQGQWSPSVPGERVLVSGGITDGESHGRLDIASTNPELDDSTVAHW